MQGGEWLEGVDIKRRNLAKYGQIKHTYFYI